MLIHRNLGFFWSQTEFFLNDREREIKSIRSHCPKVYTNEYCYNEFITLWDK